MAPDTSRLRTVRPSVTAARLPTCATHRWVASGRGMRRRRLPAGSNSSTPSRSGTHTAPPTAAIGPTGSAFCGSGIDWGTFAAGMRLRNESGTRPLPVVS